MVLLPEIGASCMEEPPIWVSGATAFEDEATCLAFGAIATVESVLKMVKTEKSFELFLNVKGSAKKKSLMMTLERLLCFIGTVIRRDTRRLARRLIPVWRVAGVGPKAHHSSFDDDQLMKL